LELIPSCKWLQKQGALAEEEVDEIGLIRDHRNEIAHELPGLLIGEGNPTKRAPDWRVYAALLSIFLASTEA
jgi:hypothetical protein